MAAIEAASPAFASPFSPLSLVNHQPERALELLTQDPNRMQTLLADMPSAAKDAFMAHVGGPGQAAWQQLSIDVRADVLQLVQAQQAPSVPEAFGKPPAARVKSGTVAPLQRLQQWAGDSTDKLEAWAKPRVEALRQSLQQEAALHGEPGRLIGQVADGALRFGTKLAGEALRSASDLGAWVVDGVRASSPALDVTDPKGQDAANDRFLTSLEPPIAGLMREMGDAGRRLFGNQPGAQAHELPAQRTYREQGGPEAAAVGLADVGKLFVLHKALSANSGGAPPVAFKIEVTSTSLPVAKPPAALALPSGAGAAGSGAKALLPPARTHVPAEVIDTTGVEVWRSTTPLTSRPLSAQLPVSTLRPSTASTGMDAMTSTPLFRLSAWNPSPAGSSALAQQEWLARQRPGSLPSPNGSPAPLSLQLPSPPNGSPSRADIFGTAPTLWAAPSKGGDGSKRFGETLGRWKGLADLPQEMAARVDGFMKAIDGTCTVLPQSAARHRMAAGIFLERMQNLGVQVGDVLPPAERWASAMDLSPRIMKSMLEQLSKAGVKFDDLGEDGMRLTAKPDLADEHAAALWAVASRDAGAYLTPWKTPTDQPAEMTARVDRFLSAIDAAGSNAVNGSGKALQVAKIFAQRMQDAGLQVGDLLPPTYRWESAMDVQPGTVTSMLERLTQAGAQFDNLGQNGVRLTRMPDRPVRTALIPESPSLVRFPQAARLPDGQVNHVAFAHDLVDVYRTFQPGEKLPPVRELTARMGVTYPELQEAEAALSEATGLKIGTGPSGRNIDRLPEPLDTAAALPAYFEQRVARGIEHFRPIERDPRFEGDGLLGRQVAQALLRGLHDGAFKPGELLPSLDSLGERLGVSSATVHRVIPRLAWEGTNIEATSAGYRVVELAGNLEEISRPSQLRWNQPISRSTSLRGEMLGLPPPALRGNPLNDPDRLSRRLLNATGPISPSAAPETIKRAKAEVDECIAFRNHLFKTYGVEPGKPATAAAVVLRNHIEALQYALAVWERKP
jgi:DNA-binding transcriptional regulator YhcF (GntR family)